MDKSEPSGVVEQRNFESDFGAILHHHSQTLMRLFLSLDPVVNYLGDNPFEGEVKPDQVDQALQVPVNDLSKAIGRIFDHIGSGWKERGISEKVQGELEAVRSEIQRYLDAPFEKKFRPPFLQALLKDLDRLLRDRSQYKIARELVRDLSNASREIQRLICLYEMNNAAIRLLDMEQQTKALRDFYLNSIRVNEQPQVLKLSSLLGEAIHELEAYAKAKRIRIEFIDKAPHTKVRVRYKETLRAFSNILHNAIKYNYQLHGNTLAWVIIETYQNANVVVIRFENWGVPIEKDEIESGLIFKPGWRGTYARLKDWSGNGIGLAEAKRSVEDNEGTIFVESKPAIPQGRTVDYEKPFLTVVTVEYPSQDSPHKR